MAASSNPIAWRATDRTSPIRHRNWRKLLMLRGVNPLYGVFLVNQLGIADQNGTDSGTGKRAGIAALGGVSLACPRHEELPPGPLATTRLGYPFAATGTGHPRTIGSRRTGERKPRPGRVPSTKKSEVYVLTSGRQIADVVRLRLSRRARSADTRRLGGR